MSEVISAHFCIIRDSHGDYNYVFSIPTIDLDIEFLKKLEETLYASIYVVQDIIKKK